MKWLASLAAAAICSVAAAVPDTLLVIGGGNVGTMNRMVFDNLAENGFAKQKTVAMDKLTTADLATAKLVIYINGGSGSYALAAWEKSVKSALVEYVRAGGGLVIVSSLEQMMPHEAFRVQLMEAFGGEVLMATPVYPEGRVLALGDRKIKYAYTDRVFPPFNDGVERVMFHADNNLGVILGIWGCKPSTDWKVALTAGADVGMKRFQELGAPFYDSRAEKVEESDGDYPVVAVREFGGGRVCWFGISTHFFTLDTTKGGDAEAIMRQVICDGVEGHPKSDTGRFIQNVFAWTANNSSGLDVAAIPKVQNIADYEASFDKSYRC